MGTLSVPRRSSLSVWMISLVGTGASIAPAFSRSFTSVTRPARTALTSTPRGVINFSAQGSALYDVASAQAPWPPVKLRGADEDVVRFGLRSKQVGDALLAAMPLQPQIVGS
jgi:hypothetical protein